MCADRSLQGSGFTLLEVVVALAIAGLALVGLFRAGSGGLLAVDTAARAEEAVQRAQSHLAAVGRDAAARTLRRLLSGIAPAPSAGFASVAASNPELKGSTESLAFVGDLPTGLGITQRADITLELRQGRLVLRWTPHRHELSNAPAPPPIETELIRGVDRIDLSYWC